MYQDVGQLAHELGESRDGSKRIIFYEPLTVLYEVNTSECTVEILSFKLSPKAQ